MNPPFKVCFLPALALLCLPSCALRQAYVAKIHCLKPNQTYEVRKAVAPGDTFRPNELSSYFFVINTPAPARPPLANATNLSRQVSYATVVRDSLPNVRTTAYCHDESDHLAYGHLNAVGTFLKYGPVRSAAADWSRYPVGTRFRIPGEPGIVYEVDDYGSALVGTGTIDLYRPTQTQMNAWGVRNVDIEVLEWGSFERSQQLLQGRTHYPHVRQMFYDIQRRLSQPATSTRTTPITAMAEPVKVTTDGLSPSI